MAAEVLETMFFNEAVACGMRAWLALARQFRPISASMDRILERSCSVFRPRRRDSIAAGFLGLDPEEMTAAQPGEVILELANILCGALMSHLWPESKPVARHSRNWQRRAWSFRDAMHRCFTLPDGMVAVSIGFA